MANGYRRNSFGASTPDQIEGIDLTAIEMVGNSGLGALVLAGGGQIPSIGDNSINIRFGDFAGNPVLFEWLPQFDQYEIANNNIPLRDFFASKLNESMSITATEAVPLVVINGNGNGQ
jgi:hypothetical protein